MPHQRIGLHTARSPLAALAIVAAVAAPIFGCSGNDVERDRGVTPGAGSSIPDTPPPGFATLMLAPAIPRPTGSDSGAGAPSGSVWYRMASPDEPGPARVFEWYVQAQHLSPNLVFRVEMVVDGHNTFSVGSARANGSGVLVAHGILPRFADQYCVGTAPTPPLPLNGLHHVSVSVKRDGSGAGSASAAGPLTDPGRMLPCGGNGDGNFEYWLVSPAPVEVGHKG